MKLTVLVLVMLLIAVPVFAADIDGKWNGSISTPNGDFPVSYTFKAEGNKLTGSTTGPDGAEIQISDGKIEGANIAFSITLDFGGMPFTLAYKGVVSGDQIKMTSDFMGQAMEFVVKKDTARK